MKKYAHIVDLPHHQSPTRARMSLSQRAAQFAPFAALTGYEAVIRETARQTQGEITLDESEKEQMNACLNRLQAQIGHRPWVSVTFFVPDGKKTGGSYQSIHERVVKIDGNQQKMVMESGKIIQFEKIIRMKEDGKPRETLKNP
jgi:hypothetical protein